VADLYYSTGTRIYGDWAHPWRRRYHRLPSRRANSDGWGELLVQLVALIDAVTAASAQAGLNARARSYDVKGRALVSD
jgi:hypothetical protein